MNLVLKYCILLCFALTNLPAKGQLPELPTDISPILVGEIITDNDLLDSNGKEVSLYSLIEGKKTIIVFYRGNWCPRCLRYLEMEYVPNLSIIEDLGYQLVAICPDAPSYLLVTSKEIGLDTKHLFGDISGNLIRLMGLGFQAKKYSNYINKTSEGTNTDCILPVTSVYIIDSKFKVLINYITPNAVNGEERMQWELLYPILKALNN
jgi:peroxiredoxin